MSNGRKRRGKDPHSNLYAIKILGYIECKQFESMAMAMDHGVACVMAMAHDVDCRIEIGIVGPDGAEAHKTVRVKTTTLAD